MLIKMKIQKLSLKDVNKVLSRAELKKIMGGGGSSGCDLYTCNGLRCRLYTNGNYVCANCGC